MRYARHASRYSLFTLAVSAALLPGAGWAANGDLAGARKPPSVACSWNREAALSYEERRLDTPLPFSGANVVTHDQTPLAERIVKGAGFDGFEPAFAKRLCAADGRTPVTSYAKALKLVTEEGRALWRAAVDRAQGRRAIPAGALPASDDRMLYWTRLYMTRTLRQWAPSFRLGKAQAQALQWRFERASRGQLDIDLPRRYAADGSRYRRMIISGFDVFTLGTPGTANTGLRNGNPSGATALALDGREFRLADGSLLRIEAYLLPVSYDPFNRGMQEDTLGPWFRPGPRRVDASITISQGGANQFWLEAWNGRFHGSSAGNDGIVYCPADSALPNYVLPLGSVTNPGTAPIPCGAPAAISTRRAAGSATTAPAAGGRTCRRSSPRPRCRSASCSPPIPGAASSGRRALPARPRKASTSPGTPTTTSSPIAPTRAPKTCRPTG
ncbi:hypothetical protein P4055_18130 [Pseudomonas aeruginosa]|nr:hypothetical protein [Pseudomonas aeruginosa]